jgi:release factor glutamine methyltransferase
MLQVPEEPLRGAPGGRRRSWREPAEARSLPDVPAPAAGEALLGVPSYGSLGAAMGRALYWHYRVFRSARHARPVLEHACGMPLLVMPGVFNPCLTRAGEFFASILTAGILGPEVLDMGTGSGVCAVRAARLCSQVIAVDINPEAVRCARINVLLNRQEDRVKVVQGDLFAPVGWRRFNVILFNPPFLHGEPRDDADRAWRCVDVPGRFAQGLATHLKPGGYALLLLSTRGDCGRYIEELRRRHAELTVVARRRCVDEILTVIKAAPSPGGGA